MMGTADDASKVLLPHKDEVQTMRTAVGLVERALDSSAKEQPKYVGPPYSLIFISKSGIKWIEKGACK